MNAYIKYTYTYSVKLNSKYFYTEKEIKKNVCDCICFRNACKNLSTTGKIECKNVFYSGIILRVLSFCNTEKLGVGYKTRMRIISYR